MFEIDKVIGRVYRFNPDRGYGFIQRDGFPLRDPAGNVFFHISQVCGGSEVPGSPSGSASRSVTPGKLEAYDVEAFEPEANE